MVRPLALEPRQGDAQAPSGLTPVREVMFRHAAVALLCGAPVAPAVQARHRHQATQATRATLIGCVARMRGAATCADCLRPACVRKGRG